MKITKKLTAILLSLIIAGMSLVTAFADDFYHGKVGGYVYVSHGYPSNYYSGSWWIDDGNGRWVDNTSFAQIVSEGSTYCKLYIKSYKSSFNIRHHYNTYDYFTHDFNDYNWFTTIKVDAPPKSKNTMTVSVKSATVSKNTLKKKAVTKKLITVKNAKGKVTYKKSSGSKYLTVNKSNGKITVKKKTKKGTYKIKVKVTAAGNSKYYSKSLTKTITIKVK